MADDDKPTQFATDLNRDTRTEISDDLKDALWADAINTDEFQTQLAAAVGLSDSDRAALESLHRAAVSLGIRA